MPRSLPSFIRTLITLIGVLSLLSAAFGAPVSLAVGKGGLVHRGVVRLQGETLSSTIRKHAVQLSARQPESGMVISLGLPIRHPRVLDRFLATEGISHGAMSHDRFNAYFGATHAHVQSVLRWMSRHGFRREYVSADGLTITMSGSTRDVEHAFQTRIVNYALGARRFYANTSAPAVPARLGIQSILGLTSLHDAHRIALIRSHNVPQCPGFRKGDNCFLPKGLRTAYDVSPHGGSAAGQTLGFTLWGAAENQNDFNTFAAATGDQKIRICAITTSNTNPKACSQSPNSLQFVLFNAKEANKDKSGLGEVAMDLEYGHGVAPGVHMKYFMGGDGSNADLVTAMSAAENDRSLHLISNSWGGDVPSSTSSGWYVATTKIFKAADAVGTTFLFSTGDRANHSGCIGLATLCGRAEYPAASPYVLAVGGTDVQLNKSLNGWQSEVSWDNWQNITQDQSGKDVYSVSGGGTGCTNLFPRPNYQKGFPNLGMNASCLGRPEPDVAADGDPYNSGVFVVDSTGGQQEEDISAGTSLATPLWGGMMADTFNLQAHNGITPFWKSRGFLTPQLYELGRSKLYHAYFHDVVCGYNGSPADAGWDQSTGLGSPDWYALSQGLSGRAPGSTGKPVKGCHLSTSSVKTAQQNLVIPQAGWPKGSGSIHGGSQSETWLDTKSFFSQFKSRKYAAAGVVANNAEQATLKIGSDTSPTGLWLGTAYSTSIQADRVVKDTVATAKSRFKLSFVDCSNGYSVALPSLGIPNNEDILTPDCQLLIVNFKDSQGNLWDAVYWIFAVGNAVGEVLVQAPDATVTASNGNASAFLITDGLGLAYVGVAILNAATGNYDPGPLPAIVQRNSRVHALVHKHVLLRFPTSSLRP